jgi:hypothetical protein
MFRSNLPIKIIFYPGTHGHYIEFVLNTLATKTKYVNNPIDPGGTFHNATGTVTYKKNRFFECYHPDQTLMKYNMDTIIKHIKEDEFFIKINFESVEDVTVQQLSLRRGPNISIDLELLTENTYNKLVSAGLQGVIDNINRYSDITPYNKIKDPSWPDISSANDFWNLPENIINECVSVFGFEPFYLDEHNTNAPRWVIRNMFKSWFYQAPPSKTPDFTICNNTQFPNMYSLSLRNIYDIDLFKQELIDIGNYSGMDFDLDYFSESIHNDYVSKVPNKNSRQLCENVFDAVKNNIDILIILNISEESYVEYLCENYFKIKFPMYKKNFFETTGELRKYIDNKISDQRVCQNLIATHTSPI